MRPSSASAVVTSSGSQMTGQNPSVPSEEPKNNTSTGGTSSYTAAMNFNSNKPEQHARSEGTTSSYAPLVLDLRQSPSIVPNGNAHSNPGNIFYQFLNIILNSSRLFFLSLFALNYKKLWN